MGRLAVGFERLLILVYLVQENTIGVGIVLQYVCLLSSRIRATTAALIYSRFMHVLWPDRRSIERLHDSGQAKDPGDQAADWLWRM